MFKVMLSEDQWRRLAAVADEDILVSLVNGQPELAKRLGVEIVSTVKRPIPTASSVEAEDSGGDLEYQG